jgi:hypothetical protein
MAEIHVTGSAFNLFRFKGSCFAESYLNEEELRAGCRVMRNEEMHSGRRPRSTREV